MALRFTKVLGIKGTICLGIFFLMVGMPAIGLAFGNIVGFSWKPPDKLGMVVCLACIPQAIGAIWDAPCRTLTVQQHPKSKIGLATAGSVQ